MSFCSLQLQEAFSLLAYRDPKQSPIGYLLHPNQREQLCADLNSAILGEFEISELVSSDACQYHTSCDMDVSDWSSLEICRLCIASF